MKFTFFNIKYRLFKTKKKKKVFVDACTSPINFKMMNAGPQTDSVLEYSRRVDAPVNLESKTYFSAQSFPQAETRRPPQQYYQSQMRESPKPIFIDPKPPGPDMKRIEKLARPTERALRALYEERLDLLENHIDRRSLSLGPQALNNVSFPEKKSKTNFMNYAEYLKNYTESKNHIKRMFRRGADCFYVIKSREYLTRYAGPFVFPTALSEIKLSNSSEIKHCQSSISLIRRLYCDGARDDNPTTLRRENYKINARQKFANTPSAASISSLPAYLSILESGANIRVTSDISSDDEDFHVDEYRLKEIVKALKRNNKRKCRYIKY